MKAAFVQALGLVAFGGAMGAAAREALTLAIPAGTLPWPVLIANVGGAFLLGLLLSFLGPVPSATARPWARRLQLFLGTGFCGGFTTYSTLAVGVSTLAGSAGIAWAWAAFYGLGTVVTGAAATWAGMLCGVRLHDRSEGRP